MSISLEKARPRRPIRARRLWAHPDRMIMCAENYSGDLTRYACIDISDLDALVEQVADAIQNGTAGVSYKGKNRYRQRMAGEARAVLQSIGFHPLLRKPGKTRAQGDSKS